MSRKLIGDRLRELPDGAAAAVFLPIIRDGLDEISQYLTDITAEFYGDEPYVMMSMHMFLQSYRTAYPEAAKLADEMLPWFAAVGYNRVVRAGDAGRDGPAGADVPV